MPGQYKRETFMLPRVEENRAAADRTDPSTSSSGKIVVSVLFICWSNVCRSPVAKSILQKHLRSRKLQSFFRIESAGVCLDEFPPKPSFAMRWAAMKRGYRFGKSFRTVIFDDLNNFDWVIVMDQQILDALRNVNKHPRSTIRLLGDFLPPNMPKEVPDPMNRPARVCNMVLDMIESACPVIVDELLKSTPEKDD
jgi:protein-tyrosine phosphatase